MIPSAFQLLSDDDKVYQRGLVIDSQLAGDACGLTGSVSKGIGD